MDGIAIDEEYGLKRQIAEHNRRVKMSDGMTEIAREIAAIRNVGANGNKYQRPINGAYVDVYDILQAYNVTNPATAHAIKKLLQPGERGHKDKLTDLKEASQSITRAIELEMGK